MSIQNIMDSVYARLAADTSAGGLNHSTALAGRIYPIEGKENAAFPHMTVSIESCQVLPNMGSTTSYDMTLRLELWTNKQLGSDAAMDIEAKLFTLMQGQSLTPTGYDRALCTFNSRCSQTVEEDSIKITDELRIRATAS